MSDADLTDTELLDLWHLAAEQAAAHRPWLCGHEDGRCKYRRLNLEECDALEDEWLARHGRPLEVPDVREAGTRAVARG